MFFKSLAFAGFLSILLVSLLSIDANAIPSVSPLNTTVAPKSELDIAVDLLKQRQFAKAEAAFKNLLLNANNKDNKLAADLLNYVAVSLHLQKKESEAEQYFRQALEKLPSLTGTQKIMRAKILSNLTSTYLGQRKNDQAMETCEEAVKLFRSGGGNARELSILLNIYGRLKMETSDLKGAEILLNESIVLRERVCGKMSAELITPLVNLSFVLLQEKKLARAEQVCQRSVQICQKHSGEDNAALFPLLSNLAEVQLESRKFLSATVNFKHALKISDKEFGTNSDESLACLLSLSEAADASRQMGVAEQSTRRVVEDDHTLPSMEALAALEQGHSNASEFVIPAPPTSLYTSTSHQRVWR